MHFQIYVPRGESQPSPSLPTLGLAHLEGNVTSKSLSNGPDGKPGTLYTWTLDTVNYEPARMEWLPAVPNGDLKAGRYLVGVYKGKSPTPEELQRPNLFEGETVNLGDGNDWHIPAGGRLPQVYRLNPETGVLEMQIKQQFAEYFAKCQRWYRVLLNLNTEAESVPVDREWWNYCLDALSMNYRMIPELASYLGLIDTQNLWKCAIATVQGMAIVTVNEEQKKSDQSSTPDGSST